jgi:hypothetical protein
VKIPKTLEKESGAQKTEEASDQQFPDPKNTEKDFGLPTSREIS